MHYQRARGRKPAPATTKHIETILVKVGQTSYADLLKGMSQKVGAQKLGVKVAALKKTEKADLLLRIEGDKEKASILSNEIKKNVTNADVRMKKKEALFQIADIDGDTDEQGIKNAIKSATDIPIVTFLRPTIDGIQAAILAVHMEHARK